MSEKRRVIVRRPFPPFFVEGVPTMECFITVAEAEKAMTDASKRLEEIIKEHGKAAKRED
jgi:hypothetical protein